MILSLKERYEDQLNDWIKQCDDKDKLIKALKVEIEKLGAKLKNWKQGILSRMSSSNFY